MIINISDLFFFFTFYIQPTYFSDSDITKRYPFTKSVILSTYYKVVSSNGGRMKSINKESRGDSRQGMFRISHLIPTCVLCVQSVLYSGGPVESGR